VPSNYDGPFRLDSQTISNSASFGLLGLVTAFLIGSDWCPIDGSYSNSYGIIGIRAGIIWIRAGIIGIRAGIVGIGAGNVGNRLRVMSPRPIRASISSSLTSSGMLGSAA
jgi:hypothetical protein